jgi:hypothetical protein
MIIGKSERSRHDDPGNKKAAIKGNSFKNCKVVFKKFESVLVAFVLPALF